MLFNGDTLSSSTHMDCKMKINAAALDTAWDKMVVHANVAARTTGDERAAARLSARQAYLEFEKMRDAADAAYIARMRVADCD